MDDDELYSGFSADEEAKMKTIAVQVLKNWTIASMARAFHRWYDNVHDQIEGGGEEQRAVIMKSETRQAQRSAAPPPPPVAPGAKAGDAAYQYGAPADRLSPGDHRLAAPMGADVTTAKNEPLYAVGLVFMEDKTLGFPRIFVRDVLPGSSAEQNSRLKRGDLLVLADSEDIYGRDLDYVATILPGRCACASARVRARVYACLSLGLSS